MKRFLYLLLPSIFFVSLVVRANTAIFGPPVVVTATTTSAQLLAANNLRTYLLIVNKGSQTVQIKFGSAQIATEGIPIPPGGSYEPIEGPSNSVWGVTASGSSAVTITQGN
jgi:hypothetical protein